MDPKVGTGGSDLKTRAARIAMLANNLSDELASLGISEPSFEHGLSEVLRSDAPESKAGTMKQKLAEEIDELNAVLTEPALMLTTEMKNPMLSIHSLVRLGVAENFPSDGASVSDLASKLELDEKLLRRLLAHAATHHVWHQSSPDFFVHTAASRLLCENEGMRMWCLIGTEETLSASLKTPKALLRNLHSEEPEHAGWCINNGSDLPIFRALEHMPERASVFAKAMTWHAQLPGYAAHYVVDAFPWASTHEECTVVDVGGSLGHISQALVERNPLAKCIVQDVPDAVAQGQNILPTRFQNNIKFQVHDFFKEQPVKNADIYVLRLILHDWSDKYASMIIKALVPALKPGAKIVINDRVVPGLGETHYLRERDARDSDMYMFALQRGKERTADDWSTLFKEADSRFELTKVTQSAKALLAVVEVTWTG